MTRHSTTSPFSRMPAGMVSGRTEDVIAAFFDVQHADHVREWRNHSYMVSRSPNYQADIATRQAAKRAAGIGPEGRCPR